MLTEVINTIAITCIAIAWSWSSRHSDGKNKKKLFMFLCFMKIYQHRGTQSDDAWIALSCMWKIYFFFIWYTLCITSVPIMYQGLPKHFKWHLWILTNSTISTLSKANPNIWQHQREIGCVCSDETWTWGMMYRKK